MNEILGTLLPPLDSQIHVVIRESKWDIGREELNLNPFSMNALKNADSDVTNRRPLFNASRT